MYKKGLHYEEAFMYKYVCIYTHKKLQCSSTLQSGFILIMNTAQKCFIQMVAESVTTIESGREELKPWAASALVFHCCLSYHLISAV